MLPRSIVRSRPACALICLVMLLAPTAAAAAQELPDAPGADAGSAASGATDEAAASNSSAPPTPEPTEAADALAAAIEARERGEAVLERAAIFQRGDVPQPTPTSLHGRFSVGARDKEGSMIRGEVERWFTAKPERMLTHRTEALTGRGASLGWNGTTGWFRDDNDQRVIVYTDDPETFSFDLDELQYQVRLTRLLLTASVMDALRPRLTDIAAAGTRDVTDLDRARHVADIVTARVADELYPPPTGGPPPAPGAPPPMLELRFAIDRETGALWQLHVTAVGRPEIAPLLLRFDFHGPTASGLRVPGNIRIHEDGAAQESLNLGVEERDGLLLFDVGAPIDVALFEPPAS